MLPRRSRARTQAAANEIRQHILSGTWANGRLLPPERVMAARFGVARNTLRRIIQQLESEGLIESHPGRGTFVRISPLGVGVSRIDALPANTLDGTEALATMLRGARPGDLMEVRALLEPLAAELAAGRASAGDIAAIEAALGNAIAARSPAEFRHCDAELHLAIFRAARNDVLLAWCEAANLAREPERRGADDCGASPELRRISDREHTEIVAALRDRDADRARELMRRHMMRARDSHVPLQ